MERYVKVSVNGKRRKEHRVVWEQTHGPIPQGYVIHHINGDGHDNRLENLMLLTHGEHIKLHKRLVKEGKDPVSEEYIGVAEDRARAKAYYHSHKKEASEHCRKYREEHKEELRIKAKEYRASHQEELRDYMKAYGLAHKEEKAEYDRRYRELHCAEIKEKRKQYFEEYRRANKGKRHDKYMSQREEILLKQKQFRDAHREEIRIKDKLWRAIRLGKPTELIEKLRNDLKIVQEKNK